MKPGESIPYLRGTYHATLESVVPNREDITPEWYWRKENEGKSGKLYLFESRNVQPGMNYILIADKEGWWCSTGYGKAVIDGDKLTIATRNSVYTFKIEY